MALEHAVSAEALRLNIEDWRQCLEACAHVTRVEPVLAADGSTRKSEVSASAVAAGGGHRCPYELYVYIDGTCKKDRVAAGFTKHRSFLHTYFRTPGCRASHRAPEVFAEACARFENLAAAAVPASPLLQRCLAPFAGDEWGHEYLCLAVGDVLLPLPEPEKARGWAYGRLANGTCGWYPPTCVAPLC